VKNTFICAVDSERLRSPINLRPRAKTAGVAARFGSDLLDDLSTDIGDEVMSVGVPSSASSSMPEGDCEWAEGCWEGLQRSRLDTYDLQEDESLQERLNLGLRNRFNTYDSMENEHSPASWARLLASPRKVTSSLSKAAPPTFVVKNTFICALDTEESSPQQKSRARAKTAGVTCLGLDTFDGPEEVDDEDTCSAHVEPRGASFDIDPHSKEGSLLAQSILRGGSLGQQQALLEALGGHVAALIRSPHGQSTLEAAVECMSPDQAAFIATELSQCSLELLLQPTTCSVMCRLLERSPAEPRTVALMDVLLSGDVASLCSHKCGHAVMATLVSTGVPRQAFLVLAALQTTPQRFARHRFASKVVSVAVRSGAVVGCNHLAFALVAESGTVVSLACHTFGVHVVRSLLASPWHSWQVQQFLLGSRQRLQKDKFGRELMREVGNAHHFTTST